MTIKKKRLIKISQTKKMKNIQSVAIAMAICIAACNSNKVSESASTTDTSLSLTENHVDSSDHAEHDGDSHDHHHATHKAENGSERDTSLAKSGSVSIDKIVDNYLLLKNALAKDDAKAAANAGKSLLAALNSESTNAMNASTKIEYLDIAESAKENAEHIGDNADKIEHQREHFVILSQDMADLLKLFKTDRKLYQDFCPMYDGGNGAYWISEVKEIKNPYLGKEMPTCGSVKKEF